MNECSSTGCGLGVSRRHCRAVLKPPIVDPRLGSETEDKFTNSSLVYKVNHNSSSVVRCPK